MEQDFNKDRLELALEAAGLDLWENDLINGDITRKATKTFAELGYTEEETSSYIEDMFKIVHPDDIPVVKSAVSDHLSGVTEQYRCEFRLRSKCGKWLWYANYGKIMDRDALTKGRRFIGVTFNIDDRRCKEDELALLNHKLTEQNTLLEDMNATLQALATSDSLTGVSNHRKLMDKGAAEVHRALRFKHSMSLLILDIDLFKKVNDTWGHTTGDQVICAVAAACMQQVRSHVDTVGRIGGEEFAIILPETNYAIAYDLAERIRLAVAAIQIPVNNTDTVNCTISIGISTLSEPGTSFKDLLSNADKALYLAKNAGRNCVKGIKDVPLASI